MDPIVECTKWDLGCNIKSPTLVHDRVYALFGYFVLKSTPSKTLQQFIRMGFNVAQGQGENGKLTNHYTIVFESKFGDVINIHGYRAWIKSIQLSKLLQDYLHNISNEILERKLEKHERHMQRWENEVQDIVRLFEEGVLHPLLFEVLGQQHTTLHTDPLLFVGPENAKFEYVTLHPKRDEMNDTA